MSATRALVPLILFWAFARAALARGFWLVASLYLVLDARLAPSELVLIGVGQALASFLFEVPTGVVADTLSRKLSIVLSHLVVALGMLMTGLVTDFPLLLVSQVIWGVGWTFSSGADIAWITDELNDPARVNGVLAAEARWGQIGSACGLLLFGGLAALIGRSAVILGAGGGMLMLGVLVAWIFPERHFRPTRADHRQRALDIFRQGLRLVRHDREILAIFAANLLIHGAADGFERLSVQRLVGLGLPVGIDTSLWLAWLGIVGALLGALALRGVEATLAGVRAAPWVYALGCVVGALGVWLLAFAPNARVGSTGILIASGIAWTVTRAVAAIWVNQRTTRDVRARVQSFLAQTEYVGEAACGLILAGVAASASNLAALALAGLLVVGAGLIALRARPAPSSST